MVLLDDVVQILEKKRDATPDSIFLMDWSISLRLLNNLAK